MRSTVGLKVFIVGILGAFLLGSVLSMRLQLPFTANLSKADQTSVDAASKPQGLPDFVKLSKSLSPEQGSSVSEPFSGRRSV
jgi:hypothetical protein